ncbi:MAG: 4-hydroxy-tetrahydrodipicolinate synthase [Clostridium sp.]|uniref:4-hydroxy-tetrahydrodipicolinate synthase n=1 Tax=Clostridium sp. TaxID=1506 RepID=UPI002902D144|nr:4-hydroxy-tetrahydrodipicolinate synthase [Clostridium sp.]MDU2755219.1 4-hydroxy-tetrahydrodipicolinate synthase [Clostridium sp.]MDU2900218.1 4-hydroxy-tetrahydrodipicolinate synthase [Clostridium sp.]
MKVKGLWVPVVTPFENDELDMVSYEKLVNHYINEGVHGLMPLGTTGETPTLSEKEYEEIVSKTMEVVNGRVPVIIGLGGNCTRSVIDKLKVAERHKVQGILSVSPYYNRPDQRGIYEHFKKISESTDLDIVLYNIPYRTGRNMENETILRLSEEKNIVGVKDASGDFNKTIELLLNKPDEFSVLSGEDNLFYSSLLLGGDGGVTASAHLKTRDFIKVYDYIQNNDAKAALEIWKEISPMIPLLFNEPNPTPIKYMLKKMGLINSDEVRLPLVPISQELKNELDNNILL